MYDIFRERGNLVTVFSPRDTELTPETNHIEFSVDELKELDAVIVEIQDVGSRYFNYTKDVFRLMEELKSSAAESTALASRPSQSFAISEKFLNHLLFFASTMA